jgi:indoleamine 2,3-dioxygenase
MTLNADVHEHDGFATSGNAPYALSCQHQPQLSRATVTRLCIFNLILREQNNLKLNMSPLHLCPPFSAMPLTTPSLPTYFISATHGFLSPNPPILNFSNKYYKEWDDIIAKLPSLISSQKLHNAIQQLPTLNTTFLSTDLEIQRAYTILGFLVHAYINSTPNPTNLLPLQLSDPFLAVCGELGMRPVLSYAGLCLWNWSTDAGTIPEAGKLHDLQHLNSIASFTGSRGEDAFYHVPVLIEAEGGPLIPLLLNALVKAEEGDITFVIKALEKCSKTLGRMGEHFDEVISGP